ncbi:MAG: septum formation protein Maf [Bacteroidetes bacterium]|nr:MAG: septum formation protein Maf [Bacteroidota bacterium]
MNYKNVRFILASQSPRRQELLKKMGVDFEIKVKSIDETPPKNLRATEVATYLAEKKAQEFLKEIETDQIVICADTTVVFEMKILDKPKNEQQAIQILQTLSGNWHEVITGVCVLSAQKKLIRKDITKVFFKKLSLSEIEFYVQNFSPYDKAGGYGIQEWIGMIGIEKIEGSYFNVMGLPTHLLYEMLEEIQKK